MTRKNQLYIGAGIVILFAFIKWRNRPVQVKVVTGSTVPANTNPSDQFFAPYTTRVPATAVITVPATHVEDVMAASYNLLAQFQTPELTGIAPPANLTGIGNNFGV